MSEQTPEIEIVEYTEDLAEDLAAMYNAWDDLWPGGYTHGVPFTAERVKKQFGAMSAIAILVAVDRQTGKPLGSCTVHQHMRDEDAVYVGTLGVRPEALNKKVGKKLLLRAIQIASARSATRVDLNTWPGNLRAVPLYKKMGMMWNPLEQGLRMETYIPSILSHPLTRPFFDRLESPHAWYDLLEREIVQGPDRHTVDGMDVYPYSFRRGDDTLSVTVDVYSRAITGVRRTISEETVAIEAKVHRHITLCGIQSHYSLKLENSSSREMQVHVKLTGFRGIKFLTQQSTKMTLKPGQRHEWTVPFVLNSDTETYRLGIRTPFITAKIVVDGQKCELKTGMVIQPPADVMTPYGLVRVAPGGSVEVPITVHSSAPHAMEGVLSVGTSTRHITVKPSSVEIRTPSQGFSGATIQVLTDASLKPGVYYLLVSLGLKGTGLDGPFSVKTREFRVPVFCLVDGRALVTEQKETHRLIVAAERYDAVVREEGAVLEVKTRYGTMDSVFGLQSEIGPPFGLHPFRFAQRRSWVEYDEEGMNLVLEASHPDRSLHVEDIFVFEHNSSVVKHEVWVQNTGDGPQQVEVHIRALSDGIGLRSGEVFLPMRDGVVTGSSSDFLHTYPSISSRPQDWTEGWIAVQDESGCSGQVWDLSAAKEVRLGQGQLNALHFAETRLEAGQKLCLGRLWMTIGAKDWQDIRRLYRSRVLRTYDSGLVSTDVRNTVAATRIESRPFLATGDGPVTMSVRVASSLLAPQSGPLSFEAPAGWTVEVTRQDGTSAVGEHVRFDDFVLQGSEEVKLVLTPKTKQHGFRIHRGRVSFRVAPEVVEDIVIVQLADMRDKVTVKESTESGSRVFTVSNGALQFKVSPDFGGCLYSLKNASGTELLQSSFPTPTPKPGGFMENYFGGIQPILTDDAQGEVFTRAETNKEEITVQPCRDGPWTGVEALWSGRIQKSMLGLEFTLRYLTLPGSPLLLVTFAAKNNTHAPRRVQRVLAIDPGFNGSTEGIVIRTSLADGFRDLWPGPAPHLLMPRKHALWLRMGELRENAQGLALINDQQKASLFSLTAEGWCFVAQYEVAVNLLPGTTDVARTCLLLDPKSDSDIMDVKRVISQMCSG
ncbi:MAG: GNAT family N-acetyltransferase [Candidatus Thorarchaeota archaeon]|nr:GNAT family N-acetyltransferase [Candidatus Thorarchaeota archaeon]